LAGVTVLLLVGGLAAGSEGWSLASLPQLWASPDGALIVGEIRAPRTLGAWLTGALLGLAGATAQGLFRNPLADPYLLGSAATRSAWRRPMRWRGSAWSAPRSSAPCSACC
jgi:iron complex transport system permease protein